MDQFELLSYSLCFSVDKDCPRLLINMEPVGNVASFWMPVTLTLRIESFLRQMYSSFQVFCCLIHQKIVVISSTRVHVMLPWLILPNYLGGKWVSFLYDWTQLSSLSREILRDYCQITPKRQNHHQLYQNLRLEHLNEALQLRKWPKLSKEVYHQERKSLFRLRKIVKTRKEKNNRSRGIFSRHTLDFLFIRLKTHK